MKTKQIIIMAFLALAFFACQPNQKTSPTLTSTDSLNQIWTDAWNASDVKAISSQFAFDAILISDTVYIGLEVINTGFIEPVMPVFRDLSCTKISEKISADLAWQSGSYVHYWVKEDSSLIKATGYYSMVWQKQNDDSWKIVLFQVQ